MHPAWTNPFLIALRTEGVMAPAARKVGISSTAVYALKAKDADFAAAVEDALEDAHDAVESALRDEALGVDELVVYQGQLTPVYERDASGQVLLEEYDLPDGTKGKGMRPIQARNPDGTLRWLTVRKRSVPAAVALLKGRRKKVFAERTEVTGADGGPVQTIDATTRRARIASILAAAKAREGLA